MSAKIRIRKPDDFHCHFRTGFVLTSVVHLTARHFARAFEEQGCLDKLEGFASTFGADFYGLPHNKQYTVLRKKDRSVSRSHRGITVFKSGETLHWQVAE